MGRSREHESQERPLPGTGHVQCLGEIGTPESPGWPIGIISGGMPSSSRKRECWGSGPFRPLVVPTSGFVDFSLMYLDSLVFLELLQPFLEKSRAEGCSDDSSCASKGY